MKDRPVEGGDEVVGRVDHEPVERASMKGRLVKGGDMLTTYLPLEFAKAPR